MATVVWTKRAHLLKDKLYQNGCQEFGTTVANKTAQKILEIEKDLAKHPCMGFIETTLEESSRFIHRGWHINKRFKIIYRYDESKDTVVIEDIWDTRRNPENLKKRIK